MIKTITYDDAKWQLVPKVPTQAMLDAARDWSMKKNGQGVGNDQATGCYQAMISAPLDQTKSNNGEMPSKLEQLLCNYTRNDRNAINRFLGAAEICGYRLASPVQPVGPDQTAAAQEREALNRRISALRKALNATAQFGNGYLHDAVLAAKLAIEEDDKAALSIPQREPCVDVEAALQLATAYIEYVRSSNLELHAEADGSPSASQAIDAALNTIRRSPDFKQLVDFLNRIEGAGYGGMADYEIARDTARGLLTGRTEAKAVPRIEGLAEAMHGLRYHGGKTLTFGQTTTLLQALDDYLRLQEAEANTSQTEEK